MTEPKKPSSPLDLETYLDEKVRSWHKARPQATLTQIEEMIDGELAQVRKRLVKVALEEDENEPVQCPNCEQMMGSNGKKKGSYKSREEKQSHLSELKSDATIAGRRFFPLDNKLGLLRGGYSPQVQEAMTRLGSRLSYKEAQEELFLMWGVSGCKATVCNTTMRYGHHNLAVQEAEISRLEKSGEKPTTTPDQLVVSVDGAMVQLTTGEWREAKLAAFGEFERSVVKGTGEVKAKTETVSYFAQMTSSSEFERSALLEWHQRGGDNAERVVAVNDGALWIQSFIDYHCPKATRVLDFAHAQSYLSRIGKAVYPEESNEFRDWFAKTSKQLGTKPPKRTLNELRFLHNRQTDDAVQADMDGAIRYLEFREEMIDYPRFRRMGIPIGSGMSESGHKVVMQRRMKQAGMRWAEPNVNAMLSLRTALCNGRWATAWQAMSEQAQAAKQNRKETQSAPTQVQHVDERLVTEKDIEQLATLKKRGRKGKQWENHDWIFPHRH